MKTHRISGPSFKSIRNYFNSFSITCFIAISSNVANGLQHPEGLQAALDTWIRYIYVTVTQSPQKGTRSPSWG